MIDSSIYILRTPDATVTIIPSEGGRIASLRNSTTGVEFLTQSNRNGPYPAPNQNIAFQDGPCAGIEECLPTVGCCGTETEGGSVPDHGDFWQLVWEVTDSSETHMNMQARGFSRPLLFSKELLLDGPTLRISYRVENLGPAQTTFLYACHPLFAVAPDDRILLPTEISSLAVYYSRNGRLGLQADLLSWPTTSAGANLEVVEPANAGIAEMLYTKRLRRGSCGIYRTQERQGIKVTFDTSELPYLGIWLCYGGWPDSEVGSPQYAVALEPTNAPFNTLAEAQSAGLAKALDSGEVCEWTISFQLSDPDISLEAFHAQVVDLEIHS